LAKPGPFDWEYVRNVPGWTKAIANF